MALGLLTRPLTRLGATSTFAQHRVSSFAAPIAASPITLRRTFAQSHSQSISNSTPMQQRPKSTFDDVTYDSLLQADPALAPCKGSPYRNAASDERIERARQGLESKGFKTHVVSDRDEAFDKVKSLIPAGASLSTAHSTTLEEIAFVNYLIDGKHPWNNIRGTILAEKDPEKQAALRRTLGTTPDYFLTSMCAVTEEGQMSHGDYSGTKVGPVSFGAGNVIVVVGSNKIVKDEAEAWKRTKEHCLPFVASYSRKVLKLQDSAITHYEVIRNANPLAPNRIQVVLIKEALGF